MTEVDLSIIIVNWNSRHLLSECLETVFSERMNIPYEVVVIDAGSFDGCGEMLAMQYPQVRFLQSERNLGFARANNESYKASRGRYILFLNPDTEVEGDAILKLYGHLESTPDAGIVGARLLNSDRSVQTSCIRAFPTILNQILDTEVLRRAFPLSRLWGSAPLFHGSVAPVEVDAVSGACLMVKRSVFEDVGRFSEDYFMYSEDVDLCYKVLNAGWKAYYIPEANVIHHGGGSSSRRNLKKFSSVMMMESRWRFFRKYRAAAYGIGYRLAMLIVSGCRIALMVIVWPFFLLQGKGGSIKAPLGKWIAIWRWAVGLETWVKDY